MPIQRLLFNPALCVARLGASTAPMDAFVWAASEEPHLIGETQARPTWTLDVQSDGSVIPRMPDRLVLKDEGRIRPVAPFLELWCDVGPAENPAAWVRQPLTARLLAAEGIPLAAISFTVTAMNRKASRRTGNPALAFGTIPPVTLRCDDYTPKPLHAVSPPVTPGVAPMIPAGRFIPMGSVQVIRPGVQPAEADGVLWASAVDVETIRIRVTPATGQFYGPPGSEQPVQPPAQSNGFSAVVPGNSFLDPAAGWFQARAEGPFVVPPDTFDGAEQQDTRSLGIVDDTCEILIEALLEHAGVRGSARANVFCGPPDFAPDRRPFLSLADEFNDRAGDKALRSEGLSDAELDAWVEDLFERAFETVSLYNIDFTRRFRAAALTPGGQRPVAIPDDGTSDPANAMGGLDALRDGNIAVAAPSVDLPLPLSTRARERHRNLADIIALKRFVREHPGRMQALIRPPFNVAPNESARVTTMQMPPFMRNSNAGPLALSEWQYALLMEWQHRVLTGSATVAGMAGAPEAMSSAAEARRTEVLRRLALSGEAL